MRSLMILALAVTVTLLPHSSHATDVHGDNSADRYVGTGGLVLPGSVDTTTRARVAGCTDCHWRLAGPCLEQVPAGHAFPGQATCMSVVRGCPAMAELLRVWFQQGSGPWSDLGLVCLGPGGPVTVAALEDRVSGAFAHDLPRLRPVTSPSTGVLAQVPTAFDTGQPTKVMATYDLLGQQVRLEAAASWAWSFGDGATMSTRSPGGPYPDMSVAHVYRSAGDFVVDVTTRWSAEFAVSGLGPFPVAEPVEQTARHVVSVGEGRAVLAVR